jgi:hypothetical protein
MPTDSCEATSVSSQVYLTNPPDESLIFSPLMALYAVLAANPVQFIFELLCIYLQKMKINQESVK